MCVPPGSNFMPFEHKYIDFQMYSLDNQLPKSDYRSRYMFNMCSREKTFCLQVIVIKEVGGPCSSSKGRYLKFKFTAYIFLYFRPLVHFLARSLQ